jgi:long-chain fatty acid transport protein
MGFKSLPRKTLLAVMLAGSFTAAHATNGYLSHGYGIKAKGMGGASVAMTHDAFAGANNPAAAAFAGKRWDLGVDLFSPRRSIERSGTGDGDVFPAGTFDGKENSRENYFLIPEFGYNNQLSDTLAINLTVYGNGGMNTNFKGDKFSCPLGDEGAPVPTNAHCGSGKLGVNLEQLIIAPTVAYKIDPNHSLGISPLLVYQRFKAYGLQAFTQGDPSGPTVAPDKLTNNGNSSSKGLGVRVGYMGRLNDQITVGASYAPKINMSKFGKYKGLFAEGGDFDIPATYTVGLAIQATPTVLVALDHQKIKYSDVDSVGNASSDLFKAFDPDTGAPADPNYLFGAKKGPGFGWRDVSVWKLGVQWQASPAWTLRAGYNKGDNPIRKEDVTFNMLAPGVVKDHFTLGGTMALDKESEVSFYAMHARSVSVKGDSLLTPLLSGAASQEAGVPVSVNMGREKIQMYENSIGIQYSKKF